MKHAKQSTPQSGGASSQQASADSAVSQRLAASPRQEAQRQQLSQFIAQPGGPPLQLRTNIDNSTQSLSYSTGTGKKKVKHSDVVGREMAAWLDPDDARKGSSPGSGVGEIYSALNLKHFGTASFIKGHLLNANLGGLGVAENLFPITKEANRDHSALVEEPVKEAFLTLEHNITMGRAAKGSMLRYKVIADPVAPGDFVSNPGATLHCTAYVQDPDYKRLYDVLPGTRSIVSSLAGGENERRNARLESKGWGSEGSGLRSGAMKVTRTDMNGKVTYNGQAKEWNGTTKKWIPGAKVLMEVM